MTENFTAYGWLVIAVVAIAALLYEAERAHTATQQRDSMRAIVTLAQQEIVSLNASLAAARGQLQSTEDWSDCWEDRALRAEAELAKMRGQHDHLQALYCHQVRTALANNFWIIARHKGVRS